MSKSWVGWCPSCKEVVNAVNVHWEERAVCGLCLECAPDEERACSTCCEREKDAGASTCGHCSKK